MKKQLFLLAAILTAFAAQTLAQRQQICDFTKELDWESINMLDSHEENWEKTIVDLNEGTGAAPLYQTDRWTNKNNEVFSDTLMTGPDEDGVSWGIPHFFGLYFSIGTASSQSKNVIIFRSGKIRLTRNGMVFTVPEVYDGQTITIQGRSANVRAENRGIEPMQDFVTLVSGTTTDGQCIFLGDSVPGAENTHFFTFKVQSGSEEPVNVDFNVISGGIELLSVALNSADVDIENMREFTYKGINYYVMDDGNALVTSVAEASSAIEVPETVVNQQNGKSYKVTQMSANAFNCLSDYFSLTLPRTITEIPDAAFKDNKYLRNINLPFTLTHIGSAAFKSCTALESFFLSTEGQELVVDGYTFQYCNNLKTVWLRDANIKEIPIRMFSDCPSLEGVSLPQSLERIRQAAFNNNVSLANVVIPSTVIKLHDWAFYNCSSLSRVVTLGSQPVTVEQEVFDGIADGAMLYVPVGTKEAYQQTDGWNSFGNVCEIMFPDSYTPFYLQNVATGQYLNFDDSKNCLLADKGTNVSFMGTWWGDHTNVGTNYSVVFNDLLEETEYGSKYFSLGENGSNGMNVQETPAAVYWTVLKGEQEGTFRLHYNITDNYNMQYSYLAAQNGSNVLNVYGVENDYSLWRIVYPEDVVVPEPTWLYAEGVEAFTGNTVSMPINLRNNEDIQGIQFDMILPDGITIPKAGRKLDVTVNDDRAYGFNVDGNRQKDENGNETNTWRFTCYGTEGVTGNSGELMNIALSIASDMADGTYGITITNVVLSTTDNMTVRPESCYTTISVSSAVRGDVNGDGEVNITDVTSIINYILARSVGSFNIKAADVNSDGEVNITDVTYTINIILGKAY